MSRYRFDAAVVGCYAILGWWLLGRMWIDPNHRYLPGSIADQTLFEWFITVDTHAVLQLRNPFFTDLQNVPDGVNLMANTSMLGVVVPLIPVTLLFGPTVTYVLMLTGGVAGTAAAWYWLFSRDLRLSRPAAAVGGAFCGFAPPMAAHATAHPNFVVLVVIPFIVRWTLRLREPGRAWRNGTVLGLLVAYQFFIGAEVLLLTALGLGCFLAIFCLTRMDILRAAFRPFCAAAAVAVVVATALLAYPLWVQFFGRQHYRGLPGVGHIGNDLSALAGYGDRSLGHQQGARTFALNFAEQNAYFGWGLLALCAVIAVWLWRNPVVRACGVVGLGFLLLSLGPTVRLHGRPTGVPGPWRVVQQVPLLDSLLPGRLAYVALVAAGVLLAAATDRAIATRAAAAWCGALLAALVPLAPTPVPVVDRPPLPDFFADGTWQRYVAPSGTLVSVPLPSHQYAEPLRWQVAADLRFRLPGGYFVGPVDEHRRGGYGPPPRPTARLLARVAATGRPARVTEADRRSAVDDLRYWRADVIVLAPQPADGALRTTVDALVGKGHHVDGVWVWDLHPVVDQRARR